jgi:hypothetical protein
VARLSWFFAILIFAALIAVVAQHGEIAEVFRLLRGMRPIWLLAAVSLQGVTYVLAAGIWWLALKRAGEPQPLRSLIVMALAMLFSNQAVPSVGVAGGVLVVEALVKRGTPRPIAMSALLLGLITTYAAIVLALVVTLMWLRQHHVISAGAVAAATAFGVLVAGIVLLALRSRSMAASLQTRLTHWPNVRKIVTAIASAPPGLLRDRPLVFGALAMQLVELAVDAATLGVSLLALGVWAPAGAVFGSFIMASVVSRVAFVPLGLGTFEATAVAMLHVAGVPIEPALAATLIFRGFTLWLPMLPGMWCAHHVLTSPRGPDAAGGERA